MLALRTVTYCTENEETPYATIQKHLDAIRQEREQFKSLLVRLRDELGTTIVLVEHDLDLVWGIADTITVLETGKVVADGSKADIDSNPAVRRLFIQPASHA